MFKNKRRSKFLFTNLLVVFMLASFGIFMASRVLAIDPIGNDQATQCTKEKKGIYLQVSIPGLGKISGTGLDYCVKSFPEYIKAVYNLFIGIVGILAVIMIMFGGFRWLVAAGNAQKISGAKTTIISAIMGLVLALGSYSILSWINPALVVLKLNLPVITKTGEALNFCPKDDNKNYIKVAGQSFNQIEWGDVASTVTGSATKCGETYYIKDRGGDTCDGALCSSEGYRCFNRVCVEGDWFGEIACGSDNNKCVDQIDLNVLCADKTSGKNYKFEKDAGGVGYVDTDERAVEYKIEKLTLFRLFDVNNEDGANQLYCGNKNYKPTWVFMSVQAKSGTSDDWRGLSSSGKDNFWSGNSALAGCYDIKPSEFSDDDWIRAVNDNQLMPLDILKEDNLPIIYNINISQIEAFNAKCGNCKKCD